MNHAAFAMVADTTMHATPQERSLLFGIVEAALWAGLLLGPVLGGVAASTVGSHNAFFAITFMAFVWALLVALTFKDTLDVSRRRPLNWRRANPAAAFSLFFQTRTALLLGASTLFGLAGINGGGAVATTYALYLEQLPAMKLAFLQSTFLAAASSAYQLSFHCFSVCCDSSQSWCWLARLKLLLGYSRPSQRKSGRSG